MNISKIQLPSNGLIENVPETIRVRGLRGGELSMIYSGFNDEVLDEVIKDIIIENKEAVVINPKDLTDQDKIKILHTARVMTFGNTITQALQCPVCGQVHNYEINYDVFETKFLEPEYVENSIIEIGDNTYERKVPTSEDYQKIRDFKEKFNISFKDDFILKQMAHINRINKEIMSGIKKLDFLKDLPGNELMELSRELKLDFGYETTFSVDCKNCHSVIPGVLGLSQNLFR